MADGITKSIALISFNENEAHAVDLLLSDLASGAPSPWRREGQNVIGRAYGPDTWRLDHIPIRGQGNVIAGVQLAEVFTDHQPPDYVVFYGCAGAIDQADADSVFLVREANYLSLGTVEPVNGQLRLLGASERVTLKNKWLCDLQPPGDVDPLPTVAFPLCVPGSAAIDLGAISGIPTARVVATDKVVRIPLANPAPAPVVAAPPRDLYLKAEWSYGEALAHSARAGGPMIVEMESYGIGRIAHALKIEDSVVVLRVTTDSLADHAQSGVQQRRLLEQGRQVLGRVAAVLFNPTAF